ncbi:MAG: hypothetical protein Q9212_000096 [Teloschistes hypoglaucus]
MTTTVEKKDKPAQLRSQSHIPRNSRRLERSSTADYQMRRSWGGHHLEKPGFVAFDTYKTLLQDGTGAISGPRTVMAGFGAGITESLLAVTPFESIKTTLWAPQTSSGSHFTVDTESLGLGLRIANQPIRACEVFYMAPQSSGASEAANSATRFGSYTTIKQFAQGYVAPGEKLGTLSTFGIGGLAGLITV